MEYGADGQRDCRYTSATHGNCAQDSLVAMSSTEVFIVHVVVQAYHHDAHAIL